MTTPKTIVITGSTLGIGKGLAREFLKRGHNVVICSRGEDSVRHALQDLKPVADAAHARLVGMPCDVGQFVRVQELWSFAKDQFEQVDIWINNAGLSNDKMPIARIPFKQFDTVVHTNLLGTFNCCKVALEGMKKQAHGAIYNFEGFGSNGMQNPGLSVYGATKFGITYFTKCLIRQTKNEPVIVGYMSPGIVLTELALGDVEAMPPQAWESVKKVYNILADRVETVTPFLVEGVLSNTRHGGRVSWLTPSKSAWRFLKSRFIKRDLMEQWEADAA